MDTGHRPSAECASAVAAYEMIMRPLRRRRTPISVPCPGKAVGWDSPGLSLVEPRLSGKPCLPHVLARLNPGGEDMKVELLVARGDL
jgi:hypothetical protein